MAASLIPAPIRYSKTLNSTVYVVPTVADITAPTRSELDAGTRIDNVIPKDGISGFAGTETTVTADDLMSGYTLAVHDGEDWSSGSTITAYCDQDETASAGTDIRNVLTKGSNVVIVLFDSTDTAGKTMDVFPCYIGAHTKSRTGMATIDIACTFTGVPVSNVAVPAVSG